MMLRLRILLIGLASLLVTGCAVDAELRVTEYGASYFPLGAVGGCRITQVGTLTADVNYVGKNCSVEYKLRKD